MTDPPLTAKQLAAIPRGLAKCDPATRLALEGKPPEVQYAVLLAMFGVEKGYAKAAAEEGLTVEQYLRREDHKAKKKRAEMARLLKEERFAAALDRKETKKKEWK